tara:strand:+ start:871 stop:1053 length:183 start_codon:yes stop_codon:yes gene_type:complete
MENKFLEYIEKEELLIPLTYKYVEYFANSKKQKSLKRDVVFNKFYKSESFQVGKPLYKSI